MPELPEVEVLCRHLAPRLQGRRILAVHVRTRRTIQPAPTPRFRDTLGGARFVTLERRGKYLRFTLRKARHSFPLIGHLGMTGRMYLLPRTAKTPPHTAVVFDLGREQFVFEDPRQFGRFTFDATALARLGPEPLDGAFTAAVLRDRLGASQQPIKVRLMDQAVVAGLGNIYASEVLHHAGTDPRRPTRSLAQVEIKRLHRAIRTVLRRAVCAGSTMPLDFSGQDERDRLFYFGTSVAAESSYEERLLVYDREGEPCRWCAAPIRRIQQAARSTFFCPKCQR
jgi:formamidopyrimidine-DNA glycosylase